MSAHKKEPNLGTKHSTRFSLGRRTVMVAIVFALVASAVFRWAVIGAWRGTPLEVVPAVKAQGMWCGKYYEQGQPPRTPGGNFPVPPKSSTPLLRFECWPGLRPYVSGLDTTGSVLLSASSVNTAPGTAYDPLKDGSVFRVSAEVDGKPITSKVSLTVGAPTSESEFTWSKLGLEPRREGYNLTCSATSAKSGKVFKDQATVFYLPPVPDSIGAVVQTDGRTGAVLVPNKQNTKREPLFPFGFYTSFGGYLEKNLTLLDEIKEQGFNMVHPVPTFDNKTALELVLDRMEELGLWLVYDMRWAYKNLSLVREEVESVKKRKNILAWYTADEPDGWEDPLDAPRKAADLINELDGYRPVALVLNCADYYFSEYSAGHQIITHDTYPIGINATWSTVWNTPCTPEVGDCGCDNCRGQLEDIAVRLDEFQDRLVWEGRSKDIVVWTVPQAFGQESYWSRRPTSKEIVLEMLLATNHGSLGIMPWLDGPSDSLMRPGISPLAKAIPVLAGFVLGDQSILGRPNVSVQRVDITTWTRNGKTLFIALNLNDASIQAEVRTDRTYARSSVVYENGAQVTSVGERAVKITFQPLSSIVIVL